MHGFIVPLKWACLALFVLTATLATVSAAPPPKFDEQQQIAILQSGPPAEKALACKRLAVSGTYKCVPALAPLLADEQLSSWARIALEAIPDSAADEALRSAAGKLKGRLLVGVINSIGVRRDVNAVDLLVARLGDSDAEVAAASAVALGRIAAPAGVKALESSLAQAPPAVRPSVAQGCILAAERALSGGNAEEAAQLYQAVLRAEVPKPYRLAAMRGSVLAQKAGAAPMILGYLRSDDKDVFAVGLWLAREIQGPELTAALIAELKNIPAAKQAAVVSALADRNDPSALPALLDAAKAGPAPVRIAAIESLGKVGGATAVPVLLAAATDSNEQVANKAIDALTDAKGDGINEALVQQLGVAEGKLRNVLIQLAGARYITAAKPLLLKAADDANPDTRSAAVIALGATIDQAELPWLVARMAKPPRAEDAQPARTALQMAAVRMPDREACARLIQPAAQSGSAEQRIAALEILAAVGGQAALQSVAAAAKDAQPEIQDAGSRLLGEWMSVDAAPILLDLAKTAADNKYKIRALRGYIRLARQLDLPGPQRLAMCREALAAAQRPEEKRLVLDVLRRLPGKASIDLALGLLGDPALKKDAAQAVLAIAEKVVDNNKQLVINATQQVIDAGVDADVTERAKALQSQARGSR